MFTLEQIKEAHSKVKSGADFPAYIQELKKLGIRSYQTFVSDGHSDFYGETDYKITSPAKYNTLNVAQTSNEKKFKSDLKTHQNGGTDYTTFCYDAAKSGVEKWEISMNKMTCTYFDKAGHEMLVEQIPQ